MSREAVERVRAENPKEKGGGLDIPTRLFIGKLLLILAFWGEGKPVKRKILKDKENIRGLSVKV